MKKLEDTIQKMTSSDYICRFVAEYWQTKIRYDKLKQFNRKIEAVTQWDAQIDEPEHDCPPDLLLEQETAMEHYLHILEVRAEIEGIDLYEG